MTDPPQPRPEMRGSGSRLPDVAAPSPVVPRTLYRDGRTLSTITGQRPQPEPESEPPRPSVGGSVLTDVISLIKWVLSDPRRAAWALLFLALFLGACVSVIWLLAPYLGLSVGIGVGGIGAGSIGGAVLLKLLRRWIRDRT